MDTSWWNWWISEIRRCLENHQKNNHSKTSLIWINIKWGKCRIAAAFSILICLARKITGENVILLVLQLICTSHVMLAFKNKNIACVCSWCFVKSCSRDVLLVQCLLHEYLSGINFQIWAVGLGSPWQVLLITKMWSFQGSYLLLIKEESKLNESWEVTCHMNQLSSLWT